MAPVSTWSILLQRAEQVGTQPRIGNDGIGVLAAVIDHLRDDVALDLVMGRNALALGVLGPCGGDAGNHLLVLRHQDGRTGALDLRPFRHLYLVRIAFGCLGVVDDGVDLSTPVLADDRRCGRAVFILERGRAGPRRRRLRRRAGERQIHRDLAVAPLDRHLRARIVGHRNAHALLRRFNRVPA